MKKKKVAFTLIILAMILNAFIFVIGNESKKQNYTLNFTVNANSIQTFQVFYSLNDTVTEDRSSKFDYVDVSQDIEMSFEIPQNTKYIRIDFGDSNANITLSNIYIKYYNSKLNVDSNYFVNAVAKNMLSEIKTQNHNLVIKTEGNDPYCLIDVTEFNIDEFITSTFNQHLFNEKMIICFIIDIAFILLYIYSDKFLIIPIELIRNRKLIFRLAKNDFKTRYAGSYFGIIWAIVQPVVTIVLYWFVFQIGLKSTSVGDVPFVLWLIAGLIPWFFFSDIITFATNCLLEYSYLVKKVVFNISVIPMVKIISAFFIHLFFVGFMLIVFCSYGFAPNIYSVQLIYYTFCIFILGLAITYATSAIILFFKDLGQIITIFLMVGMWMSPIMWRIEIIPMKYQWIFKANPLFYIIEGYRDSLINQIWFFEKLAMTFYFWLVTGLLLASGTMLFRKLRPHFADVL